MAFVFLRVGLLARVQNKREIVSTTQYKRTRSLQQHKTKYAKTQLHKLLPNLNNIQFPCSVQQSFS